MSPQMEGRLTDRRRRRESDGGTYLASAGKPTRLFNVVVTPESGRGKRASWRKNKLTGRKKRTMHKLHCMLCVTSYCVRLSDGFTPSFRLALIGLRCSS